MDRLLVDAMCGKLATYLRMCGYDAAYALDLRDEGSPSDDELLDIAREEDRRIVTRDRELAARADDAVLLERREVEDQLRELAAADFDLSIDDDPTHCGACNGALQRVGADEPTPEYAPDPATTDVWRCADCGQYFWKGSHWDDVAETVASIDA